MKIMTFECVTNEKKEKWLVDMIEKYIAKIDPKGKVHTNYFITE